MLKIFLVEDEYVVREGIKNIDWASHGYDFVGEASDGEIAYPMIDKLKPDIVITDIKMPFMDGLELSKLIKKDFPQIEIIILSGYAEFEYAREAINIGVAHYLTKPISAEHLIGEVDSLAHKIEERKKDRAFREKYLQDMKENMEKERNNLFNIMVTQSRPVTDILEMASKLDISLSALFFNVVLMKIMSKNHSEEEYSESVIKVRDRAMDYIHKNEILMFDRGIEGVALVFKAGSREEIEIVRDRAIAELTAIFEMFPSIRYFGGIGTTVSRLREIGESFEAAGHAFAHRFFKEDSVFVKYNEISPESVNTADFDISNVDTNSIDRSRILQFLKQGEKSEVTYFVEEFMERMGENAANSFMMRQYIAMDIYFAIASFLEEIGQDKSDIPAFDLEGGDIKDSESLEKYIVNIIDLAVDKRQNNVNKKYNDVVETVIEYINEHYSDEDLSLNMLASYVNFSPNHLSMMFGQQTGKTFIKYLTDFRMNKAKELLRCTNKRSVDISVEVGYKDPHYFSYCFKKYQGVTPTQYRNGENGTENPEEE